VLYRRQSYREPRFDFTRAVLYPVLWLTFTGKVEEFSIQPTVINLNMPPGYSVDSTLNVFRKLNAYVSRVLIVIISEQKMWHSTCHQSVVGK